MSVGNQRLTGADPNHTDVELVAIEERLRNHTVRVELRSISGKRSKFHSSTFAAPAAGFKGRSTLTQTRSDLAAALILATRSSSAPSSGGR